MSKIPQELEPVLHRQRRFCVLMSLAIIAFYVLGIDVKSEAQYSGFVLTLENPNNVIYGLWLVWGWALVRYFQRIYELFSVILEEIVDDVDAEDLRIANSCAKKFGNKLARKGQLNDLPENARIRGRPKIDQLATEDILYENNGFEQVPSSKYVVTREGGRKYSNINATFDWNAAEEHGSTYTKFSMELSRVQVAWLRSKAWFHALIRLPAVTEYIAPFVFALIAIVVAYIDPCVF